MITSVKCLQKVLKVLDKRLAALEKGKRGKVTAVDESSLSVLFGSDCREVRVARTVLKGLG